MKSTFSLKKILILVTILAVPGFLYYLLQEKGKNRYKPLGIYGPKQVAGTFTTRRGKKIPDTIYHTIRDFKLVNQAGDSVQFPSPNHRITVANFFYSRCPSVCQKMNRQVQRVYDNFQRNEILHFMSFSVDPATDTPEVLAAYAKNFQAIPDKWDMLTGNQNEIFALARHDFLLDAVMDTGSREVLHSSTIVLVDPQKRIRGFYDSSRKESVDLLIDEIKVLIAEELRGVKNR